MVKGILAETTVPECCYSIPTYKRKERISVQRAYELNIYG